MNLKLNLFFPGKLCNTLFFDFQAIKFQGIRDSALTLGLGKFSRQKQRDMLHGVPQVLQDAFT